MEAISLPIALFASVAAALLSRRLGSLLLRAIIVLAVAFAAAYLSLIAVGAGQHNSWTPLQLQAAFGVGAVFGLGALLVSHWLLQPRRRV